MGLRSQGYDVSVVTLNDSFCNSVVAELQSRGIEVVVIGKISLLFGFGLLRLGWYLRQRRNGALITVLWFSDIIATTLAKVVGVRRVIRAVRARNCDYSSLHWFFERLVARLQDAVVFNSKASETYEAAKLGMHPVSRCVIYNWIPQPVDQALMHQKGGASLKPVSDAASDTLVIGVLGRLAHQKNVALIIKALSKSGQRNIVVRIAGEGALRSELESLISELGLQQYVSFEGYRTDALAFLSEVDLLVSASRFEGQPNSLLEAIAVGCPVLISDIPEHRETIGIFGEGVNIEPMFFRDNCVDSLAYTMQQLGARITPLTEISRVMNSRAVLLSEERMITSWAHGPLAAHIS
jgi:glycosyltransferase involved in cell wall biosynthesis